MKKLLFFTCTLFAGLTSWAQSPPCTNHTVQVAVMSSAKPTYIINGKGNTLDICETTNGFVTVQLTANGCDTYIWAKNYGTFTTTPQVYYGVSGYANTLLLDANKANFIEVCGLASEGGQTCASFAQITINYCFTATRIEEQEMNTAPVQVKYYTVLGQEVKEPVQGVLYIRVGEYSNGFVKSTKIILE